MTVRSRPAFWAIAAALLAAPMLSGCDWFGRAIGNDTQMKNVEILPGTASDEMVTLDSASGDGTALDPSGAVGPEVAADAADAADASDASSSPDATDTTPADGGENPDAASPAAASPAVRPGDVVIRPPAGRPEATKAGQAPRR